MTVEWILILTLVTGDGAAVAQIGPFTDVNQCRAAGQLWFNRTYPNFGQYRYGATVPNYVCVPR